MVPRPAKDIENSIMGCMASATTVCIMIPMDTVKTRLVTQMNYPDLVPYKGIIDCYQTIFREEGIGAFYRGLTPRLLSVVPMIGIQFGVYEVRVPGQPVDLVQFLFPHFTLFLKSSSICSLRRSSFCHLVGGRHQSNQLEAGLRGQKSKGGRKRGQKRRRRSGLKRVDCSKRWRWRLQQMMTSHFQLQCQRIKITGHIRKSEQLIGGPRDEDVNTSSQFCIQKESNASNRNLNNCFFLLPSIHQYCLFSGDLYYFLPHPRIRSKHKPKEQFLR